jgi:Heterokaryon incompatibility protein (HET)
MTIISPYRYHALRENEVRPCQTSADPTTKQLLLNLSHFPIDSCPLYVAISYTRGIPSKRLRETWSSEADLQNVLVRRSSTDEFRSLQIRRNLYSFFEHLVDEKQQMSDGEADVVVKYIWVDAICIDQSNFLERSQ